MSERTIPSSFSDDYHKAFTANLVSAAFATLPDTLTEPTGTGIIVLPPANTKIAPTWLHLIAYGLGSNNDVFDVRIAGWRKSGTAWTAVRLLSFTATLGAKTGIAGGLVGLAEVYADTIGSVAVGTDGVNFRSYSPADDTAGYVLFDTLGCQKLQIQCDTTTGTPTMNFLYARV